MAESSNTIQHAELFQWLEQLVYTQLVVGSNPTLGNMKKETKCKKCNDSGWVEEKKYQCVPRKEEYSGFVAILYLECECKKEKKSA